jgi:hypothetical protein
MVMFGSQNRSKPTGKIVTRSHQGALGREVAAKPAVDIRTQNSRSGLRPFARVEGLASPERSANKQSETCLQSYLQWAGFTVGAQGGEFGFGAYFVDDEPNDANGAQSGAGMTEYTWTPSRRG